MVKWNSVLYGIVAALFLGGISGAGIPFTNATLPVIGLGLAGLFTGVVAGYSAYQGVRGGALHGFLASIIGGTFVASALVALETIAEGLGLLGLGLLVITYIVAAGIPGVIGGALGGMIAANRRPKEEPSEESRPVA